MTKLTSTTKELLGELFSTCCELNRDDFHVWIGLSGHVPWIEVSWVYGGWDHGKSKSTTVTLHLDGDKKNLKEKLSQLINRIKVASADNPSKKEQARIEHEKKERAELRRLECKYKETV